MGRPGIIAFPVILVLGGITAYLTITSFTNATPEAGIVKSPYWKELSASTGNETSGSGIKDLDESKFTKIVTVSILEGSATQGNPDYDPDAARATSDALITWVNKDTTLHTTTSGSGSIDAESGKLFDSGFLNPADKYSVPAEKIGTGEHPYYCQVHPYMTSSITIE